MQLNAIDARWDQTHGAPMQLNMIGPRCTHMQIR